MFKLSHQRCSKVVNGEVDAGKKHFYAVISFFSLIY